MAFNGNFMCTSFKKELLYGVHDFDNSSGDTFKIALYTNSATFTAATTAYTTGNEVSGTFRHVGPLYIIQHPILLRLRSVIQLL